MVTIVKLLSLFNLRRTPACGPDPEADTLLLADAPDETGSAACGWFDSSHDLAHGLVVREHATPAAVVNDLPLAGWLQLQLGT